MRYAISDIHGCNKTFHALLAQIKLKDTDTLFLLGDYVDRGPDSKGVLDTIMTLRCQVVALRGNHEELMLTAWGDGDFVNQESYDYHFWMVNGGGATLRSLAGTNIRPYLAFLKELPPFVALEDFYLVHAEFDFSLRDPFGRMGETSMLWSRGKPYHGKKPVICGHTPQTREQITAGLKTNKMNIDNGCYLNKPGYHHLASLCLDSRQLCFQENIDDEF